MADEPPPINPEIRRQAHELFTAMRAQGWTDEQIFERLKAVLGGD